jgi:hypothetical protein
MPARTRCRTFNLIQGRRMGTRSMKRQIEKPSEPIMRFFTPELYKQFNSSHDDDADRADEAWEAAIQAYQSHLDAMRDKMPREVQKLADLCLHDAEILAWDHGPFWAPVAVFSLRRNQEAFSIIYFLLDHVREQPPKGTWPFSKLRKHWLYDELDMAKNGPGMFLHRVLLSDGTVLEIPFGSVMVQSFPLAAANGGAAARQIA